MQKIMIILLVMMGLLACGCSAGADTGSAETVTSDTGGSESGQATGKEEEGDMTPVPIVCVRFTDSCFVIDIDDTPEANDFLEKIKKDDLVVDKKDIMLDQENRIKVRDTVIGQLNGGSDEDIAQWNEAVESKDDSTAEFFVEWTE